MKAAPFPLPAGADAAVRASKDLFQSLFGRLQPPEWLVDELQNRFVLLLNHVLMQEPQAQERLRRQTGKPVKVQWGAFHLTLAATAAGLLERPQAGRAPELTVTLPQTAPLDLAKTVLAGEKPSVDIQGDVQLAAEVAWLVDNVRWDLEEDLARLVGDGPAHTLVQAGGRAAQALRALVGGVAARAGAATAATPASAAPLDGGGRP